MQDFTKATGGEATDLFGQKVKRYLSEVRVSCANPVTGKHPVWLIHKGFPFDRMRDDVRIAACAVLVAEALGQGLNGAERHQFELLMAEGPTTPLARALSQSEQSAYTFIEQCTVRHNNLALQRMALSDAPRAGLNR